jgi:hypothetical protein
MTANTTIHALLDHHRSDPDDIPDAWRISPRGAGYLFGAKVTTDNGLSERCWVVGQFCLFWWVGGCDVCSLFDDLVDEWWVVFV